jgi:hypothetical protein
MRHHRSDPRLQASLDDWVPEQGHGVVRVRTEPATRDTAAPGTGPVRRSAGTAGIPSDLLSCNITSSFLPAAAPLVRSASSEANAGGESRGASSDSPVVAELNTGERLHHRVREDLRLRRVGVIQDVAPRIPVQGCRIVRRTCGDVGARSAAGSENATGRTQPRRSRLDVWTRPGEAASTEGARTHLTGDIAAFSLLDPGELALRAALDQLDGSRRRREPTSRAVAVRPDRSRLRTRYRPLSRWP